MFKLSKTIKSIFRRIFGILYLINAIVLGYLFYMFISNLSSIKNDLKTDEYPNMVRLTTVFRSAQELVLDIGLDDILTYIGYFDAKAHKPCLSEASVWEMPGGGTRLLEGQMTANHCEAEQFVFKMFKKNRLLAMKNNMMIVHGLSIATNDHYIEYSLNPLDKPIPIYGDTYDYRSELYFQYSIRHEGSFFAMRNSPLNKFKQEEIRICLNYNGNVICALTSMSLFHAFENAAENQNKDIIVVTGSGDYIVDYNFAADLNFTKLMIRIFKEDAYKLPITLALRELRKFYEDYKDEELLEEYGRAYLQFYDTFLKEDMDKLFEKAKEIAFNNKNNPGSKITEMEPLSIEKHVEYKDKEFKLVTKTDKFYCVCELGRKYITSMQFTYPNTVKVNEDEVYYYTIIRIDGNESQVYIDFKWFVLKFFAAFCVLVVLVKILFFTMLNLIFYRIINIGINPVKILYANYKKLFYSSKFCSNTVHSAALKQVVENSNSLRYKEIKDIMLMLKNIKMLRNRENITDSLFYALTYIIDGNFNDENLDAKLLGKLFRCIFYLFIQESELTNFDRRAEVIETLITQLNTASQAVNVQDQEYLKEVINEVQYKYFCFQFAIMNKKVSVTIKRRDSCKGSIHNILQLTSQSKKSDVTNRIKDFYAILNRYSKSSSKLYKLRAAIGHIIIAKLKIMTGNSTSDVEKLESVKMAVNDVYNLFKNFAANDSGLLHLICSILFEKCLLTLAELPNVEPRAQILLWPCLLGMSPISDTVIHRKISEIAMKHMPRELAERTLLQAEQHTKISFFIDMSSKFYKVKQFRKLIRKHSELVYSFEEVIHEGLPKKNCDFTEFDSCLAQMLQLREKEKIEAFLVVIVKGKFGSMELEQSVNSVKKESKGILFLVERTLKTARNLIESFSKQLLVINSTCRVISFEDISSLKFVLKALKKGNFKDYVIEKVFRFSSSIQL